MHCYHCWVKTCKSWSPSFSFTLVQQRVVFVSLVNCSKALFALLHVFVLASEFNAVLIFFTYFRKIHSNTIVSHPDHIFFLCSCVIVVTRTRETGFLIHNGQNIINNTIFTIIVMNVFYINYFTDNVSISILIWERTFF